MAEITDMEVAEAIKTAGWWQGSVLPEALFEGKYPTGSGDGWWVITSQTCNLYNPDFEKIPVFEMVAAKKIDALDKAVSKGNNPRILHVRAESFDGSDSAFFEIDIQNRVWENRKTLGNLGKPTYEICDATHDSSDWFNNQWLDNFAGWISRSYTRVTLPDDFNNILRSSKVQSVLDKKLQSNDLYGIYFSLSSANDDEWAGVLGLMPPPYLLEILLISDESKSPKPYVEKLKEQLFENKLTFNLDGNEEKLTRSEAAERLGLTIIPAGITGQGIAETTLLEIKSMIRYTLNDFLSRSGSEP